MSPKDLTKLAFERGALLAQQEFIAKHASDLDEAPDPALLRRVLGRGLVGAGIGAGLSLPGKDALDHPGGEPFVRAGGAIGAITGAQRSAYELGRQQAINQATGGPTSHAKLHGALLGGLTSAGGAALVGARDLPSLGATGALGALGGALNAARGQHAQNKHQEKLVNRAKLVDAIREHSEKTSGFSDMDPRLQAGLVGGGAGLLLGGPTGALVGGLGSAALTHLVNELAKKKQQEAPPSSEKQATAFRAKLVDAIRAAQER